jgi:outer membrane protein OmpA-like peptidoglycan-associated protein
MKMRKFAIVVPVVLLMAAGSTACATKTFVHREVGQVNTKVEGLSTQLEETQERTRKNEQKTGEVDLKADQAAKAAEDARSAATVAATTASAAGATAAAVDAVTKRLVYEVVLSEDQGNFTFGKNDLPDGAKGKLDEMITQLKADPKAIFIEVEGHTDNVGGSLYNEQLGLQRAESVKRYLYEAHQIPLHKMNTVSYGETKPVASNHNRKGRAQNRRIIIKVLA